MQGPCHERSATTKAEGVNDDEKPLGGCRKRDVRERTFSMGLFPLVRLAPRATPPRATCSGMSPTVVVAKNGAISCRTSSISRVASSTPLPGAERDADSARLRGARSGHVVVFDEYKAALSDLLGFDRVWLLYHLDRSKPFTPLVVPYRDSHERGLFSTRAPARPNLMGMSAVKLVSVEGATLVIEEIDIIDGTLVLDIKP